MNWLARDRRSIATYAWLAGGIWALLVAAATAELLLTGFFRTADAIAIAMRDWLPWIALAPAVVWLARCFPLEHGRLRVGIPVHVLACAGVVILNGLLEPRPPGPDGSPWRRESRGGDGRPPSEPPGPWNRPGPFPGPRPPRLLWDFERARMQVPVYWLIVSVVQALALYRRSQERERKAAELSASLAQARLQVLRTQLQPHFLFNALNAVSALIHKDPRAADDMLAELSDLLRMSLGGAADFETPLYREFEVLACYLRIERRRFGDRLDVRQEIEPGVERAQVPALLLQPLAENAVRHGVGATGRPVRVEVTAKRAGPNLELRVTDDGPGLKDGWRDGIGLTNTRARLRELYGEAGLLRIESPAGSGCVVTVQIPFHTEPLPFATPDRP